MRFRAFRVDWDTLIFFENFRELRATREARIGSKGVKNFLFAFLRVSEHFESIETHFFFSKILVNFALRAKRVMGQKGKKNFVCIFTRFRAFWVDWGTLFFSKIFVSAKRETRASEASEMRAQSAKPEGAKRPSSPAGLAGRSASRACKLVRSLKKPKWSHLIKKWWPKKSNRRVCKDISHFFFFDLKI